MTIITLIVSTAALINWFISILIFVSKREDMTREEEQLYLPLSLLGLTAFVTFVHYIIDLYTDED